MGKKVVCFFLIAAMLLGGALLFRDCAQWVSPESESLDIWGSGTSDSASSLPQEETPSTPAQDEEWYSAMWLSYLEWESVDFSTEETFTRDVSAMLANCANLGVTTVIAQVRPFGDALYRSSVFPTSHLITGTQGDELAYDPLAILINGAHALGLRLEAWVNPYRVQLNENKPASLSAQNPAVLWQAQAATSGYVHEANGGLYYDPGVPAVRTLIEDGVRELVENYAVDGIQFDDYFYPTTDTTFDAETFVVYGEGQSLADWRRENVNTLVRETYALIKQANPACTFGISPSGNIQNNLDQQYSDVTLWLSTPGYVDYLMPQIYWGYHYTTASGSTAYAFENCLADWCALERAASVQLYVGLGAYRIGDGDGSADATDEWSTGENLARMVRTAREQADGAALYRYDFLYRNTNWDDLATKEAAALQLVLAE